MTDQPSTRLYTALTPKNPSSCFPQDGSGVACPMVEKVYNLEKEIDEKFLLFEEKILNKVKESFENYSKIITKDLDKRTVEYQLALNTVRSDIMSHLSELRNDMVRLHNENKSDIKNISVQQNTLSTKVSKSLSSYSNGDSKETGHYEKRSDSSSSGFFGDFFSKQTVTIILVTCASSGVFSFGFSYSVRPPEPQYNISQEKIQAAKEEILRSLLKELHKQ